MTTELDPILARETSLTAGEMGARAAAKYLDAHPDSLAERSESFVRSNATPIVILALVVGFALGRAVKH